MLCGATAAIFTTKQWQMGLLHLLRSTDTFKPSGEARLRMIHCQVSMLDNEIVAGSDKL